MSFLSARRPIRVWASVGVPLAALSLGLLGCGSGSNGSCAAGGGPEQPYDGVDNDCDPGTPDDDLDGDDHLVADDCDDQDPARFGGGAFGDVTDTWTADDVAAACVGHCPLDVLGSVSITDGSMTRLPDLACVTTIGGNLEIGAVYDSGTTSDPNPQDRGNPNLTSLAGLEAVQTVGGSVAIEGNDALTSVAGLAGLTSIGGDFLIGHNDALATIDGMWRLQRIGGRFEVYEQRGPITIEGFNSLTEIGGSLCLGDPCFAPYASGTGLTSVGGLRYLRVIDDDLVLVNNRVLTDVTPLAGLTLVGGDVTIRSNPCLTDEAGRALVDDIDVVGGGVTVNGNTGCSASTGSTGTGTGGTGTGGSGVP